MEAIFFAIVASLMVVGGQAESYSQSCSMVNGVMQCDRREGSGNVAGSSAGAFSNGNGGGAMNTFAGVGDTSSGTFSSSETDTDLGGGPYFFGPNGAYTSSFSSSGGGVGNPFVFNPFGAMAGAGAVAGGGGAFAGAGAMPGFGGFGGFGGFPFFFGRR